MPPKIEVIQDGEVVDELPSLDELQKGPQKGPQEGEKDADDSSVEESQEESAEKAETEESDEVVVTIGDEKPEEPEAAPQWVRELRKANREKDKRIRELEAKLTAPAGAPKLGKKPALEDFDFDTEKFEKALESWYDDKRKVDEAERKAQEARENEEKAWRSRMEAYAVKKSELKVKDFEDAEMAVQESLSVTQQGIIVQGAENPALLVYALGKNPAKLKELQSISDPVKFAFQIAKLESQVKTSSRKPSPPPPERRVSGTAPISGSVDSVLEKLREEAARTGNYTKVIQYKRQKQA